MVAAWEFSCAGRGPGAELEEHMRLPISMTAACMLVVAAASASGASFKFDLGRGSHADYDDCNPGEQNRTIAGCTRFIDDRRQGARNRALAYVARGVAYFANGGYDRAIADYNAAISIDKTFVNLAVQRGSAW